MDDHSVAYVALDTSKLRNAVAIAEAGRDGEIRYLGEIDNAPGRDREAGAPVGKETRHADVRL